MQKVQEKKLGVGNRSQHSSQIDLNDTFDTIVLFDININWIHDRSNDNMTSPEPSCTVSWDFIKRF